MAHTKSIFIIDRSGSMGPRAVECSQAINKMITEQREDDIDLVLVDFSEDHRQVYSGHIAGAPHYHMQTGGLTRLCDAVGRTVDSVGEELARLPENERPKLVNVTIVTDGVENDSREYKKHQIADKIKHQTDKYSWNFAFIGADIDAFSEAGQLHINKATTANADHSKISKGIELYASKVRSVTRASQAGADHEEIQKLYAFSDAERESLK